MIRAKSLVVALSALVPLLLSSDAGADATFALQWRDSGNQFLGILPGDPGGGGQRTLDIIMSLDVQWTAQGVTVAIPDGTDLGFLSAERWTAPIVPGTTGWSYPTSPRFFDTDNEFVGTLGPYQEAIGFVSLLDPPSGPPYAQPGAYVIGSILVDTSAVLGPQSIESLFIPGLDGLGIDDGNGSVVYSDDATFLNASLGTAQLVLVPEPTTAALLAAGLLALGSARRRSAWQAESAGANES